MTATASRTSIEVKIAGEYYALSAEVDEDQARECARIVDERMRTLSHSRAVSPKNAAIMAALALTDELLREREAADRRLAELAARLDAALEEEAAE